MRDPPTAAVIELAAHLVDGVLGGLPDGTVGTAPRQPRVHQRDAILEMNAREVREMDLPAGGLMTTAGDLALFYQALLNDGRAHDGTRIWQSEMLHEARRIRSGNLLDPARGVEQDARTGKLDSLADEALRDHRSGKSARPVKAGGDGEVRRPKSPVM